MTTDELFLAIYQTVSNYFTNHFMECRRDYVLVMNPNVHRFLRAYNQGIIAHNTKPIKDTIFGVEIEDADVPEYWFSIKRKEAADEGCDR